MIPEVCVRSWWIVRLFQTSGGDATEANRLIPFSQFDSQNPEDLWKFLDKFQKDTGAEVLAIPHNGNLSNGRMFSVETFNGKPLNRELAELRASLEPIIEVTQIKGDSEAHPMLSPNDEFADYETWDRSNLNGTEAKKRHATLTHGTLRPRSADLGPAVS